MNLPIDVWRHIISFNNPESDMMLKNKDINKLTPYYVCMYNSPKQTKLEYIKSSYKVDDIIEIYNQSGFITYAVIINMNPTNMAPKSHTWKLLYKELVIDEMKNWKLTKFINENDVDKSYKYNFFTYKPRCPNEINCNHRPCVDKLVNLNTHRIKKYKQPNINSYKTPEIKQYDIIKITQVISNHFHLDYYDRNAINTQFIVYTGEWRCMNYNDFLEYENPRGIKSRHFNNTIGRTHNCLEYVVLDSKMLNEFFKDENRDKYKARILKDEEQYYRRRLK